MPIQVQCSCGQSYSVPDEAAGKTTKCRACNAKLPIPTGHIPTVAQPARWYDDERRVLQIGVKIMVYSGIFLGAIGAAIGLIIGLIISTATKRPPSTF